MTTPADPLPPTDREIYLFDLRGYIILKNAVDPDHLAAMNAVLDAIPPLKPGEWYGGVHAHSYGAATDGLNLQQIYEAGEPFERLIDNPSWIAKLKHFIGGQGTFDHKHGEIFIDEAFANLRGPGEAIGLHSGGHTHTKRTQYHWHNGKFYCGQCNIILALNDIGPGDGATMVVPGSHKANYEHPDLHKYAMGHDRSVDGLEEAVEVHLQAGDAILFVDAMMHGSAKRRNPGKRRITVYRYGASWGFFRHPYRPTRELLERLTPERRAIVWPHEPIRREPNAKPGFTELDPLG